MEEKIVETVRRMLARGKGMTHQEVSALARHMGIPVGPNFTAAHEAMANLKRAAEEAAKGEMTSQCPTCKRPVTVDKLSPSSKGFTMTFDCEECQT